MHLACVIMLVFNLLLMGGFVAIYLMSAKVKRKGRRQATCLVMTQCGLALWFILAFVIGKISQPLEIMVGTRICHECCPLQFVLSDLRRVNSSVCIFQGTTLIYELIWYSVTFSLQRYMLSSLIKKLSEPPPSPPLHQCYPRYFYLEIHVYIFWFVSLNTLIISLVIAHVNCDSMTNGV